MSDITPQSEQGATEITGFDYDKELKDIQLRFEAEMRREKEILQVKMDLAYAEKEEKMIEEMKREVEALNKRLDEEHNPV